MRRAISRSDRLGVGAARRRSAVPTAWPPTSPEQRRKVAHLRCLVCGRVPVDPAHLVPRALGGCASADCVIPLCPGHHRLYDAGEQILAPFLRPELERELRHALTHVGCAQLETAMTRGGWTAAVSAGDAEGVWSRADEAER